MRELTLTTNGSQLARYAEELAGCGVRRVNVSLDTLDPAKFRLITRRGDFDAVIKGIEAAQAAGLAVNVNVVALKGVNEDERCDLVAWAHAGRIDITFIEVMRLGEDGGGRSDQYLSMTEARERLDERFALEPLAVSTGGPARYARVLGTDRRVGFITRSPITSARAATG